MLGTKYYSSLKLSNKLFIVLILFAVSILLTTIFAQTKSVIFPKNRLAFSSVVKLENVDTSVYAEWVDGKEKRIVSSGDITKRPEWVLLTDKSEISGSTIYYGISNTISPRHLRFGFYKPINIGTIFTEAGGCLSVLKSGVPYPGNLCDESQWLPAQRLINGNLTKNEAFAYQYSQWVLPLGTQTRAIRFSHYPNLSDQSYSGILSGVFVSDQRFINIGSEANVATKSNMQADVFLHNELNDIRNMWENRNVNNQPSSLTPVVSKDNPEWILLYWSKQVKLNALVAFSTGFNSSEVQIYTGNSNKKPDILTEANWKTIQTYDGIVSSFGSFLPTIIDFGQTVNTTAVRLKITSAVKFPKSLTSRTQNGKRIWLGELMALQSLGTNEMKSRIEKSDKESSQKAITIPFTLSKPGFVTMVIENSQGVRVRNLISDTWFNAGKNIVWWDGLDDLGRDGVAANHGIYNIPARYVSAGKYNVRGLVHGEINTSFEFSVYSAGYPAWSTDDNTGAWLANHSAPQAALFVPSKQSPTRESAVFLGSYVSEGVDGLIWTDLEGKKKGGKRWVGGGWTGAPFIAKDAGKNADTSVCAYVASVWDAGNNSGLVELRFTALTANRDRIIVQEPIGKITNKWDLGGEIGGLAVNNNLAVISRPTINKLLFIDILTKKIIDSIDVPNPHGLAFDNQGKLIVISNHQLLRFANLHSSIPETLITNNLDDPIGITLDSFGNFYISDRGESHQVKVFSSLGKYIHAIGNPGRPKAGKYDSLHMNNPAGLTIDSLQHLWVAENDFLPKRVSVWSLEGKLIKAFYGPSKYGGGGTLDGHDKNKFYYADGGGAMEFELDWKTGKNKLKNIYYRTTSETLPLSFRSAAPETALYFKGKRYFTNCYNSSPTNGHFTIFLFVERNGVAIATAAMGRTSDWPLLTQDTFKSLYPVDTSSNRNKQKLQTFFIWTDQNEDGQVQPKEITIKMGVSGCVTVMEDLSFCMPIDGIAYQFFPNGFPEKGKPYYTFNNKKVLTEGVLMPFTSGGGQILAAPNSWTIATDGILPFDNSSICGSKNGKANWSYPSLWPGLHPSHNAPLPQFNGELIGTTRLLGGLMNFKDAESGPLWAVNSNHGMVYIFTSDGLFVTTLFQPSRSGKIWKMPLAVRGMNLNNLSLSEENFWPTITQTQDGDVYMVDGGRTSLLKVDGLKNIHRLSLPSINVTDESLNQCREYQLNKESERQNKAISTELKVPISKRHFKVDGNFDDFSEFQWVDIDNTGIYSNALAKLVAVQGAISVSENKLYVGYKVGNTQMIRNSGEMPIAPFKTGGALDLMLSTNPNADKNRQFPVKGDMRLILAMVKGKPLALLFSAKVPGTKDSDKVPFSSPWRTITFDNVEDVSSQIQFAASKDGNFEFCIPLTLLNLKPQNGMELKGDIGILRGDGKQTISRAYWTNKATAIVSDVPSEAELTPDLWGTFKFVDE